MASHQRVLQKNLLDADVQVPGFRRSNQPIEILLNKYIPSVTIVGSMILGALAGFDFLEFAG